VGVEAVDDGSVVDEQSDLGYTFRAGTGTDGSDEMNVDFTGADAVDIDLTSALGTHVDLLSSSVENYEIRMLEGDDDVNVFAPVSISGTLEVFGDGPGGSDQLRIYDQFGVADDFVVNPGFGADDGTVVVNAVPVNFVGIESLLLLASYDPGDDLTVNDDMADNTWNLFAGPIFGDRIQVDDRASVDYAGFDTVELVNSFGTDVFNVQPTDLTGFNTSLTVTGNGDDALVAIGTAAADSLVAEPGGGGQGTATVNGVDVWFDGMSALVFEGLEGDDTLLVDNTAGPLALASGVTFHG